MLRAMLEVRYVEEMITNIALRICMLMWQWVNLEARRAVNRWGIKILKG